MKDLIEALNRAHELDEARSIKEERVKTPDAVIDVNTSFHNAAIAKELGIRAEDILWEIEPDGFSVDPDFKDYIVRDVNGNSYNVRVMGPRPARRKRPYTEAAFSGGMAGDNSASGGTIRGRGASTQPGKNNYLNRMKSKNPDLVDTMVIKVSDIKPGMITQAGQVKEAEARNHNSGVKKMYIMHTNGYDGFWSLDETMDVMVDPENKSKPFAGDYRDLLKKGLQESYADEPSIEEVQSRVPDYLDNHPYSKDLDVEDICEEVAANLFDLDYHEMSGDVSYEIFNIVSRYVDSEHEVLDEALVTDYMDRDTLHRAMQHLMFGTFNSYNQEENMIVKTTTNHGAFGGVNQSHRYFKFVRGEDGWEAYEVSSTGDKVGDTFLIDNI